MKKADESLPVSKEEFEKAKLEFYQAVKVIRKWTKENAARNKAKVNMPSRPNERRIMNMMQNIPSRLSERTRMNIKQDMEYIKKLKEETHGV